ncbi:Hypothetical predicted protein [Lynx pardinus]|uniref:Uncharacterized protein n=1 Tax=Lynx pardinus TaxID=191816 RepID=A0A485NYK6_LYNPA|nr:Hypothetical predicted protein [Lynx pardinus]
MATERPVKGEEANCRHKGPRKALRHPPLLLANKAKFAERASFLRQIPVSGPCCSPSGLYLKRGSND